MAPDMSSAGNSNDNSNNNQNQNQNQNDSNDRNQIPNQPIPQRTPYLFFFPNFLAFPTPHPRIDPLGQGLGRTERTRETEAINEINHERNLAINSSYNMMERLSDDPVSNVNHNDNGNGNSDITDEDLSNLEIRHESTNINATNNNSSVTREPRSLASFDRNSSYGILNSSNSLSSIEDEILEDPLLAHDEDDLLVDPSTQGLIAMLDRIHRINVLSRAIEEERRRQRELEIEQERERQRELLNSETNELNSFVNLLNTMIFLLSAERQLRRPLMGYHRGFYRRESEESDSNDDLPTIRGSMARAENESERRGSIGERDGELRNTSSEIRYVRPNPNPIITTPFMYTRFEMERPPTDATNNTTSGDESTGTTENESTTTRERTTTFIRPSNNIMYFNLPLSFDIANLVQILTASNSHSHPGASKDAMENSTRIVTPEMMKFGTRLQTQPNCIICQEDFITNVNKRLKSKSKTSISQSSTSSDENVNKSSGSMNEVKENSTSETSTTITGINTEDDNIRLMPCGHIFHESCIFQWLKDNNTCPVCRYELETDDEEYNEGVHKRMAERGIDIPSFNIDFTFFCSLEKKGNCKFMSNLLKKRLDGNLPKCNSIENLVSHSITQSNTVNMRYTRLPRCNHEFHWPCLKEALLKAGYHWEEEGEEDKHKPFYIPKNKKQKLLSTNSPLKNKKSNVSNILNINIDDSNNSIDNNSNNTNNTVENDIIVTDLEEEEEVPELEEEIDYSIQSTSRKPTTNKKSEDDGWIEIKCPVCMKINKIPKECLKSKEVKPATINRSKSLTTLPKAVSFEKLELKKLTTYNSLLNICSN